jgi:glucuronokinase
VDYCQEKGIVLHGQNFSVRYQTSIPQQVGLAGSSAIITATLYALMEFYGIDMPLPVQPTFVLAVEGALGIAGGLQDRVIQCYEGMVYMDFAPEKKKIVSGLAYYDYEPMDPTLLPPIYVAYHATLGEPTEVFHNDIRSRYNRGDPHIVQAMKDFAQLAQDGRQAILDRDATRLSQLIDQNFDLRNSIFTLAPWQIEMVQVARSCGASAKFAGSGGAIIGVYRDEAMFQALTSRLEAIGSRVIKPQIVPWPKNREE